MGSWQTGSDRPFRKGPCQQHPPRHRGSIAARTALPNCPRLNQRGQIFVPQRQPTAGCWLPRGGSSLWPRTVPRGPSCEPPAPDSSGGWSHGRDVASCAVPTAGHLARLRPALQRELTRLGHSPRWILGLFSGRIYNQPVDLTKHVGGAPSLPSASWCEITD